jgi:hypothetical protein
MHPPPEHVITQVEPAAHDVTHPPPEHVPLQVAPSAHDVVQVPCEHVFEHSLPRSQLVTHDPSEGAQCSAHLPFSGHEHAAPAQPPAPPGVTAEPDGLGEAPPSAGAGPSV